MLNCEKNLKRPYDVIDSKTYEAGRFTVVKDTILIKGKQYPYSYLLECDCVCVTVIYNNEVVLLNQYRHAINEWKLEFPCGGIDSGEDPAEAARREVLEETGLIIDKLIPLGNHVMRPGVSTGKVHHFLALCSKKTKVRPEPTELIKVFSVPIEKLEIMIREFEFAQMLGIVCWMRAKNSLDKENVK